MTEAGEDPELKIGPIPATRAVRRAVQKFKMDHHLKNASQVIEFLLNEHETREDDVDGGQE